MSDNIKNLDLEFKRYLQILRPYLGQLIDQDAIDICNAWIKRLSACKDNEKTTRNKYAFTLCYQLAKGLLDKPFIKPPKLEELIPMEEIFESETSTEEEYLVVDGEENSTKVLYNNKKPIVSDTEYLSQECDVEFDNPDAMECDGNDKSYSMSDKSQSLRRQTIFCYTCPEVLKEFPNEYFSDKIDIRATNLIFKLREIKKQNMLLHNELVALKEENKDKIDDDEIKVDTATSVFMRHESTATLNSLKTRLQEAQNMRNTLLNTVSNLQDQLENYNELKNVEIEDLIAKHQMEIINVRTATQEDQKLFYENKLDEMKRHYEDIIQNLKHENTKNFDELTSTKDETIKYKDSVIQRKDNLIQEKDKLIQDKEKLLQEKNNELIAYKQNIEELKVLLKNQSNNEVDENLKLKTEEFEKKLTKMEKSKAKITKNYESRIAYIQREKHLTECSLQLQLVKQRAQVINEVAEENQVELTAALDKLEAKYKDIVANVQATAIQRRMQDQMALEAILQAACGTQNENFYHAANPSQSAKTFVRKDVNQSYDSEISNVHRQNKMGNKIPFGEDAPGFCLDSERLGELFEKVYIPQRDTGDMQIKK